MVPLGESEPERPTQAAQGDTVAYVYRRLHESILRRALPPGSRLIEAELTQTLAVSRGPVREALRRLAAEGLVEHIPNKGGAVRRISRTEMREAFEVRIALESLAAKLAAQRDDALAHATFREAVDSLSDESPRDASRSAAETALFHEAMLTLAGNATLRDLVRRLRLTLVIGQTAGCVSDEEIAMSMREHRAIAEAILLRDAAAAVSALQAHLEREAALVLS